MALVNDIFCSFLLQLPDIRTYNVRIQTVIGFAAAAKSEQVSPDLQNYIISISAVRNSVLQRLQGGPIPFFTIINRMIIGYIYQINMAFFQCLNIFCQSPALVMSSFRPSSFSTHSRFTTVRSSFENRDCRAAKGQPIPFFRR